MKRSVLLLTLLPGVAVAQPGFGPRAPDPAPSRPIARDVAYGGVLELAVDARDVDHKVMHVRERLPLGPAGKPLTLLYPQWESASHAPTLEANSLAFRIGLAPGAILETVNGAAYSDEVLRAAVGRGPITLGARQDGAERTLVTNNSLRKTWSMLHATGSRSWLIDILRPKGS